MKKIILYILLLLPVLAYNQSGAGYHLPKKTTTEIAAITGMVAGEMVYNTTTGQMQIYTGSTWAGLSNIDTVAKVSRIANYTGTAKAIVVTDSLEGGLFVLSPKIVSVNNALYYKDGNGRQFGRQYNGHYNLQWFGAKPDNTGDLTVAINAAIAASKAYQSTPFKAVGKLYLPAGNYRKETQLVLDEAIHLVGEIGSNNSNTIINDVNGTGFVLQHSNQVGVTTVADASRFENLKIIGQAKGTGTGFEIHAQPFFKNVRVNKYGKGVHIQADLSQSLGNANHWSAEYLRISECTQGLLVEGDDANAGVCFMCSVNTCDTGFVDRSLLGNMYIKPHGEGNDIMVWTSGSVNESHFSRLYAEGSSGVGQENEVWINDKGFGDIELVGDGTSQLKGDGFYSVATSTGRQFYKTTFSAYNGSGTEITLGSSGNRFLAVLGLGDTSPGLTARIDGNNNYMWAHRNFDARRVFQIASDNTTSTNQHGTTLTGGTITFPWGLRTGGTAFNGTNATRIMGGADTTGVVSPVNGDIFFNSIPTGLGGVPFYYRKGGKWVNPFAQVVGLQDADGDTKIQVEESADEDILRFDAGGNEVAAWTNNRLDYNRRQITFGSGAINTNTAAQYTLSHTAGQYGHLFLNPSTFNLEFITNGTSPQLLIESDGTGVGINATTVDASAILDVQSTTQGMLLPRMTTAQRDAISTPAIGLTIYNTTTNEENWYNGTNWQGHDHIEGIIHTLDPTAVTVGQGAYSFVMPFDAEITEVSYRTETAVAIANLSVGLSRVTTAGALTGHFAGTVAIGSRYSLVAGTLNVDAGDKIKCQVTSFGGTVDGLTMTIKYRKR